MSPALLVIAGVLPVAQAASWAPDGRGQRLQAKAEKHEAAGNLEKALRAADKALAAAPETGALLLLRARLGAATDDTDGARAQLDQGAALFPSRWEFSAARAALEADQGAVDLAALHADTAWARGATDPALQGLVGWHAHQTGGPAALATWLDAQPAPFPARPCLDAVRASAARDPGGAVVALQACRATGGPLEAPASAALAAAGLPPREADAVAAAPRPDDVGQLAAARAQLAAGQDEAAAQTLDALVLRFPMDPELRLLAAEADRRLGFRDQARTELAAAAGLHPAALVGSPPPRGLLRTLDAEEAAAAVGGAAVLLAEMLVAESRLDDARALAATTRDRLGDGPALRAVQARLDAAAGPLP